ncbi:hypothetical protein D9615_003228 [Tricholomella constricta]|uniref:HNH nuclease domain-containing protein n=1 Tax=Tricholomella constricta TaxID=117010 RepID=A0A8H5M801_9AGAR|nr:hypothetical protein D9615_003228 [Tricholomella constricta]
MVVWSAATGECLRTLVGHESLVRALAFDPGSRRLVSASYDRSIIIKVWDLDTGKLVQEFKDAHSSHIFDVRFDVTRIIRSRFEITKCNPNFAACQQCATAAPRRSGVTTEDDVTRPSRSSTTLPTLVYTSTMPKLPLRHERPILPLRSASLFPERASKIAFWHPGTNSPFLFLPANDISDVPNVFGLHHGTALLACQVLAFNEPGYLSTSRDPEDVSSRHDGGPDSLLLQTEYYYFPVNFDDYKICVRFSKWRFPHKSFSGEDWGSSDLDPGIEGDLPSAEVASQGIKQRDKVCAISADNDSLTLSHLVPIAGAKWLRDNEMGPYTAWNDPLHLDPTNLLAMRSDLHHEQFNHGTFAIVPKCGELRVHFLKNVCNAANYYHNTVFEHRHVSRQLLFARFALQVITLHVLQCCAYGHGGDASDGGGGGGGGSQDVGDGGGGGSEHVETRGMKRARLAEEGSGTMEASGSKKTRKKKVKISSAAKRMETESELATDTGL